MRATAFRVPRFAVEGLDPEDWPGADGVAELRRSWTHAGGCLLVSGFGSRAVEME